jgi:c(7)-type cytochrome triheme protein
MTRLKRYMMLAAGLASVLVGLLTPNVAYVQEQKKFEGGFWSKGQHFQFDGAVVPVYEDGIHDPTNDAVKVLQEPAEAMANFPRDNAGLIDWVKALDQGLINPRKGLHGEEEMFATDFDVIFKKTGSMPFVRFPHRPHTEWLTCRNCHPKIFLPQKGGNPITMSGIIQGNYCGVCHGKVAFPPTKNCGRCHSVPKDTVGLK